MPNAARIIERANEICERIYALAGAYFDVDRDRHWFDQLCTHLALLTGDSPIEYLDHTIGMSGANESVVVVITNAAVIIGKVVVESHQYRFEGARAVPRRDLSEVEILKVTSAVGHTGGAWPKYLQLRVKGESFEFILPFREWGDSTSAAALAPLVAALVADSISH